MDKKQEVLYLTLFLLLNIIVGFIIIRRSGSWQIWLTGTYAGTVTVLTILLALLAARRRGRAPANLVERLR